MNPDLDTAFEHFASAFVDAYWSAVKDGTFSMPPNEPVEESLEELLSAISYTIGRKGKEFTLRMTTEMGDWWMFGFSHCNGVWKLMSASARSDKRNSPHDLLGAVYESYFRPMLEHATTKANKDSEQVSGGNGGQHR